MLDANATQKKHFERNYSFQWCYVRCIDKKLVLQSICAFLECVESLFTKILIGLMKQNQSLLFYLEYIVLNELLNNPIPSFK